MGAAFVSQQYLQNVLGYSTLEAGAAFLPAVVFMVLVAPRSAKLVEARGARFTLLCGYVFLLLAFATMLLLWKEGQLLLGDRDRLRVHRHRRRVRGHARLALADQLGAGAARRHGVGHRRPPARPRRRDHAVDLRRAAHRRLRVRRGCADRELRQGRHREHAGRADEVVLERRGHGVAVPASVQENIIAGAKTAFLHGDQWAYIAGIVAIARSAPSLVFFLFPKQAEEEELLARYHAEDTGVRPPPSPGPVEAPAARPEAGPA